MEPQIQTYVKDLLGIHTKSFNVDRGGASKYTIINPGIWKTYVYDDLNLRTEIGNHLIVADEKIVVDGKQIDSLCWKTSRGQLRCLTSSGIKIRIGAIILARHSIIDQLPTACTSNKMLYHINSVERDQDMAEFAVKVLAAKNTLNDDALVAAILNEIGKIRLAKYTRI